MEISALVTLEYLWHTEQNFPNAFTMERVVMFRREIASGNQVAVHMMVSKHWLLLFFLGRGSTQSTKTRSNGSPAVQRNKIHGVARSAPLIEQGSFFAGKISIRLTLCFTMVKELQEDSGTSSYVRKTAAFTKS